MALTSHSSVRVGIVGTGWGRMHVGAFRAAGANVVALCGRDLAKTRAIAAREGIGLATTELEALCEKVDVVVVATPDRLHYPHVVTALKAERHVFCEKPLAGRLDEARDLVRRASITPGARTAVSFPYRQLPPLVALRNWLTTRGSISQIDVTLRSGFLVEGGPEGSAEWGGASHVIDAALWLAGEAAPVQVEAALEGAPVHASALHLWLRGGTRVNLVHRPTVEPGIHGSWALSGPGWEAGFFAGYQPKAGGWVVSAPRAFVAGGSDWENLAEGAAPRPQHREPWAEAHVAAARAFLEEGGLARLASFEDGLRVQAVIDAAERSAASGRKLDVSLAG